MRRWIQDVLVVAAVISLGALALVFVSWAGAAGLHVLWRAALDGWAFGA